MKQRKIPPRIFSVSACILICTTVTFLQSYIQTGKDKDEGIHYVKNPKGGRTLGYAESSGVKIIVQDGF
jgi:hypothetical protein